MAGSAGAIASYWRALVADDNDADARFNMAVALKRLGRFDEAQDTLRDLVARHPDHARGHASLAQQLETTHRRDDARRHAELALALEPGNVVATLAMAALDLRDGLAGDARRRLDELLTSARMSATNEAVARNLMARTLDSEGDTDAAFEQFERANRILLRQYRASFAGDEGVYALPAVRRMRAWLEAGGASGPAPETRDESTRPVFLLGFPRSGTTLLERVLDAHPDIVTLEEQETLIDLHTSYLADDGGLARLTHADADALTQLRTRYVARVESLVPDRGARTVVDKLPLNTALLPAIHRVFPDARILFAVRDPRGVVLSCFMQNFTLNAAMAQFLELESTVRYYHAVMSLGLEALDALPIDAHQVRYEAVVDDLEGEARRALEFLGLTWDPGVLRYRDAAPHRRVRTPSYDQVDRPIYRDAIGRWRRYASRMQAVLPMLGPVASRLGYGEADA